MLKKYAPEEWIEDQVKRFQDRHERGCRIGYISGSWDCFGLADVDRLSYARSLLDRNEEKTLLAVGVWTDEVGPSLMEGANLNMDAYADVVRLSRNGRRSVDEHAGTSVGGGTMQGKNF